MKKIYLLLLFVSFSSFSQIATTQEEYNYLTKGYKIQVSSGLDMKSGYDFQDLLFQKVDSYEFDFKYLVKTKDKTKVAIFIIAKSNVSGATYYYCIPRNNPDLMSSYYSSISAIDERMTTALAVATSIALSITTN